MQTTNSHSGVDASNAYNTVANHPVTQNITQGPAAQAVYDEKDKTANEFRNVLDSRRVPDQTAANGQALTHYHSLFYNILSWKNPRVTTISYASIIVFIFFTRYVPVLKYVFKGLYIVLGITAAAEISGKLVLDRGLASNFRPRKYYTISRETLDTFADDFEQFVNFFVIEFQRIVFAENIYATVAAFTSALFGYLLVKIVPAWGLALIATSLVYFLPLIYVKNQRVIDQHLRNAGEVINQQATQVRDLAVHHTNRATEVAKSAASEYSAKAQDLIGQGKNKAASPAAPNPANLNPYKNEPEREFTKEDLPTAPKNEPFPSAPSSDLPSTAAHTEPLIDHSEPINEITPIPDTAATIPEDNSAELSRAAEVDGIKPEALAS
ncbi:Reticulon-domain-containing protein [Delphinella strobiligena]|nr:Reticulon-domain-containing protein [Delphinella strobiligena]